MFETITTYACAHAPHAYWFLFLCIMLAGLNIPISEDLIVITSGMLVSTCIPVQFYSLYLWMLAACWISAWEAYWLGRVLGPQLYEIRWFKHLINPDQIAKLHVYYEKFGILTFIVGRFIPGGVRNALFMTAGMGKMPFGIFILRDGLGCLLSTLFLYSLGYFFGQNHEVLIKFFKTYQYLTIFLIFSLISIFVWIKIKKPLVSKNGNE